MSTRRCPKCDQAVVSCNDYFFCWRYGAADCAMRALHREAIPQIMEVFDDEEDFLEWLFFNFVGYSRIQVPLAVTVDGYATSADEAPAAPSAGYYTPQETPFTEVSQ